MLGPAPEVGVGGETALQFGQQAVQRAGAGDGAGGEAVERDLGRAGAPGDRVPVARIGDQGGVDQVEKIGARLQAAVVAAEAAAGDGAKVGGQPPAGVEGRAEGGDALAADQRLEPGEGGEGPDFVDLRQEGGDVGVGQDGVGVFQGLGVGDGAGRRPASTSGWGL